MLKLSKFKIVEAYSNSLCLYNIYIVCCLSEVSMERSVVKGFGEDLFLFVYIQIYVMPMAMVTVMSPIDSDS